MNLLEENMRRKFHGSDLDNDFVDRTPKVQATETKINKWDYSKPKSFCTAKETINK